MGPVPGPIVDLYQTSTAPGGWGGSPAVTVSTTTGGIIQSSAIYFNSAFNWNTTGIMIQSQMRADVRTIAVHELGHEVFLNHPSVCGSMTPAEQAAAMNPAWVTRWNTASDDKAGLAVVK